MADTEHDLAYYGIGPEPDPPENTADLPSILNTPVQLPPSEDGLPPIEDILRRRRR